MSPLHRLNGRTPRAARKRVVADEFFFVREALRSGVGVGILPTFLCQNDLAAGTLVRVLPR
jgi:DNA-binding transcriptional LysR family regulator